MFVGSFEHQLDDKGRVVLPAKFRDRLAAGGFVTTGRDRCLQVWTTESYEAEAREMRERQKRGEITLAELRAMAANSAELKPDSQGRVALPLALRQYAELSGAITVNGVFDYVELWDSENWLQHNAAATAQLAGA
jgi:MraZ protein